MGLEVIELSKINQTERQTSQLYLPCGVLMKRKPYWHRAQETALLSEVLAVHAWGPEFGSPAPVYEASGSGCMPLILALGGGDRWVPGVQWPGIVAETVSPSSSRDVSGMSLRKETSVIHCGFKTLMSLSYREPPE